MSQEEKISFLQVKINEARVLKNKNAFDYWTTRLQMLKNSQKQNDVFQEKNIGFSDFDLPFLIKGLRDNLEKIQESYHYMLSDGFIDDKELAILIGMIKKVIDNGYTLKLIATDDKDLKTITAIIDTLESELSKVQQLQTETNARSFRS